MSARTIQDFDGNIYLNSHMNRKTIKRYTDISSEFRMILRDSGIRCDKADAIKKYDSFPFDIADLDICFNPYSPMINLIRISKYKEMERIFLKNIQWADRVIIASAAGIYSQVAIRYCRMYNKKYMLLVGGFAYESDWNHGLEGKLVAWKHEQQCKKNMAMALYGLYVTQYCLQERYPCNGRTLGCSDVEITELNSEVLDKKVKKIVNGTLTLSLGTVANIDDKRKGHKYVIKAISILKKRGYKFEYHLLGSGSGKTIMTCAKKYGVLNQVFIDGARPHNEVYSWLDDIDIYIQPSFTEGLCRAVVEAMSRACPVICTDAGGNRELCPEEFLVNVRDAEAIADALEKLIPSETRKKQAEISFKRAYDYFYETLDRRRTEFLIEFMG